MSHDDRAHRGINYVTVSVTIDARITRRGGKSFSAGPVYKQCQTNRRTNHGMINVGKGVVRSELSREESVSAFIARRLIRVRRAEQRFKPAGKTGVSPQIIISQRASERCRHNVGASTSSSGLLVRWKILANTVFFHGGGQSGERERGALEKEKEERGSKFFGAAAIRSVPYFISTSQLLGVPRNY